jgi:hypothetical protein
MKMKYQISKHKFIMILIGDLFILFVFKSILFSELIFYLLNTKIVVFYKSL